MTITITWFGILAVIGGFALLVGAFRVVMFLWMIWRWGK